MTIRRAVPVVVTEDPQASREFYEGFLGFRVAMEQDGLLMLASPSVPTTQIIIAWASATPMDPEVLRIDVSVEVEDVDATHSDALARGLDVIYPLTDEPWGVRRFFVREPGGTVLNVVSHIARPGG